MRDTARLRRVFRGSHFRASSLKVDEWVSLAPFVCIEHVLMSRPPPLSQHVRDADVLSYLFLDSETGSAKQTLAEVSCRVAPGGVYWLPATGHGCCNEGPAEVGKVVHALNVYIDTGATGAARSSTRAYIAPQAVPVYQRAGVRVRVALGSFKGLEVALPTHVRATLLDISLESGASLSVDVPQGWLAVLLPIIGKVSIDSQDFDSTSLEVPVFPPTLHERRIELLGGSSNCKVVALAAPTLPLDSTKGCRLSGATLGHPGA